MDPERVVTSGGGQLSLITTESAAGHSCSCRPVGISLREFPAIPRFLEKYRERQILSNAFSASNNMIMQSFFFRSFKFKN